MRVLKFRIVSPTEAEQGRYITPPCYITAVFQNGSKTLTVVYTDVLPGQVVEVYHASDNFHVPARFTPETVREFVESGWYLPSW